jgi:type I restriction-modification system DNA methylase subunit
MIDKLSAKEKIENLVTRFEEQYNSYKNSDYNETQTRRDFIDPFFKALGWDMDNEEGYAEAYREVINEDKVRVSGATKAPDYSFRLVGGKRLFFVEAKKPSVSVKDDIQPAYQVRRYGWSAKLPISIITDFEEFAIYDCTKKPDPTDKSSVSRIKYLTFRDYSKEFDFIWDTFSKEQVLKGSFDKFVQSDTYKKGTATVDKDFLESLDRWRTYLAVNISWNNKNFDEDEINFIVQQTIDRIIFLRIAEDRSVEPYGTLKHAIKQGNLYQNLFELFHKADEKYNSGLFDFKKDKISHNVVIENKIIRTIINELYYPECPYEFSVLSVEILGSAYEQFLGKVIRITPAHHAKIEEKPEVRKAGGVYYTPHYIVDYIVKNTVGKLIEGKTPKEISKIKILDPACGSGSFLIGAFQYLLDYHKDYYSDKGKPSKGKKDNPLTPDGHLTSAEKKRILLNNIFGVDLDSNAVEVTKLSLLIKCLEGETEASIQQQLRIWNERVLPSLDSNIKDGNSLIDTNFYDGQIDFDLQLEKRIKPFNWKKEFSDVFNQNGFDIVIGNPPYVGRSTSFEELEKRYIKSNFETSEGKFDLYQLFIEKSTKITKPKDAYISLITPQTWLSIIQATKLRKYLLLNFGFDEIVFLGKNVFEASVDTIIFLLKTGVKTKKIKFIAGESLLENKNHLRFKLIDFGNISKQDFIIPLTQDKSSSQIIKKIYKNAIPLSSIGDWYDGVKVVGKAKNFAFQYGKVDESFSPMYSGSDIERYNLNWSGLYCCRDKEEIIKHIATDIRLRDEKVFKRTKIIIRKTGNKIIASIDENKYYYEQSLFSFSLNDYTLDLKIILAVLNSKIGDYLLKQNSFSKKDTFPQIRLHWLKEFPIILIDNKDQVKKSLVSEIVKLVDQVLKLNKEKVKSRLQTKINQLQRKIDYYETRINKIVYQLYGLTENEIKLIEN